MFNIFEPHADHAAKPANHPEASTLSRLFDEAKKDIAQVCHVGEAIPGTAAAHLPHFSLFDAQVHNNPPAHPADRAAEHGAGPVAGHVAEHASAHKNDSGHNTLLGEIENVGKELLTGAEHEIVHHPVKLLAEVAGGAAIGVALGVASPWVALGAGVVGVGAAVLVGARDLGAMVHDTAVVANPESYSASEVASARHCVQNFGAGIVDTTAGLVGGLGGGIAGAALKRAALEAPALLARLAETISEEPAPNFAPAGDILTQFVLPQADVPPPVQPVPAESTLPASNVASETSNPGQSPSPESNSQAQAPAETGTPSDGKPAQPPKSAVAAYAKHVGRLKNVTDYVTAATAFDHSDSTAA